MYDGFLTDRQTQVLSFLSGYIRKKGYPPTVREIARHFRMSGPKGAKKHLDILEKKGFIRRTPKSPRAIELAQPEGSIAGQFKADPLKEADGRENTVRLPLIGQVRAGTPVTAEENIEEYFSLDTHWLPGGERERFILRVRGESMIEAHIQDGDYVIVAPRRSPENGEIVVALVEGETTLKRFYRSGETIRLKPANRQMQEIVVKPFQEVRILGRVVAVFRKVEGEKGLKKK
ncbi:MAG TPA: transcriptional repressor LexA [Nitrospiria bacterium]|nr:transcriptional repressor LexA [Nitrospiria bacterium]